MLWPSLPAIGRHHDFDPYNHLYAAIISVGTAAYDKLDTDKVDTTGKFLAALANSIKHCATSLLAVYLRKTQDVVRMWVQDPDRKIQSSARSLKALHGEVRGKVSFS
jgi:hypothetical protein